jgi:pyruvate/2-oxoglutarate dehydrogenase complex dihydrolipoamide dehydrogenase (E3) component
LMTHPINGIVEIAGPEQFRFDELVRRALAGAGRRTLQVERAPVGGTCVNWGCAPTKTMVGSARVAYLARRSSDYGINSGPISVDLSVVRQRKRDLVDTFHSGTRNAIESTEGLDLFYGEASFTGHKTIQVDLNGGGLRELTAEKIFIDTGTETNIPPVEGLECIPYVTSTTIMELAEVPEHLIVLGGGYIGLEFAQMFRRFGSEVTVIQRGEQLLRGEDTDIANEVCKVLEEDGIQIQLKASMKSVVQANGGIRARVSRGDDCFDITGTHLLIATGRKPSTDVLAPERSGIEIDERGFLPVNDRLEKNV